MWTARVTVVVKCPKCHAQKTLAGYVLGNIRPDDLRDVAFEATKVVPQEYHCTDEDGKPIPSTIASILVEECDDISHPAENCLNN